jgi:hypothetical protein
MFRKRRRALARPRLGNAEAYEGNLVIPPAGGSQGPAATYRPHGGHVGHGGGDQIPPSVIGGGHHHH